MIEIPSILADSGCQFIRVRKREKAAIDPGWENGNCFPAGHSSIIRHLKAGGNYGVKTGPGIVIIDCDDPALVPCLEPFRETLIVRSSTPDRGHYYLQCPDAPKGEKITLHDPETGGQIGDIRTPESPFYVVGPGSIHPSGAVYTAIEQPILEVSWEEIERVIAPFLKSDNPRIEERWAGDFDNTHGLQIDVLGYPGGKCKHLANGEIQGEHPVHGSENGQNYCINPIKNTWHCFRHETGGGPVEFLAVKEGFIRCEDVRPGWKDTLSPEDKARLNEARDALVLPRVSKRPDPSIEVDDGLRLPVLLDEGGTHFLEKVRNYGMQASDAYPEYWHAAAVIALSIAVNRRCYVRLKQMTVFPNIYAFLLGDSTIARKTTSVKFVRNTILPATDEQRHALPQNMTPESFIEEMAEKPRSAWILDEAAGLLSGMQKQYMAGFKDLLNALYDNDGYKRKIRGRKNEQKEFDVIDPYLNILFATTPDSLYQNTDPLDLTSGWLFRFLWYHPDYKKKTMPLAEDDYENNARLMAVVGHYQRLIKAFDEKDVQIRFRLDDEGLEAINFLQEHLEDRAQDDFDSGSKTAVIGRLIPTIIKLAALYKVGSEEFLQSIERGDPGHREIEIERCYIVEAVNQAVSYFLPVAGRVIGMAEQYRSQNVQDKILGYLKRSPGKRMKRSYLMQLLHIKAREVDEHLQSLIEAEQIVIEIEERPPGVAKATRWVRLINSGKEGGVLSG